MLMSSRINVRGGVCRHHGLPSCGQRKTGPRSRRLTEDTMPSVTHSVPTSRTLGRAAEATSAQSARSSATPVDDPALLGRATSDCSPCASINDSRDMK